MTTDGTTPRYAAVAVLRAMLLFVLAAFWLGAIVVLWYVIPQMKQAAGDSGRMLSNSEIVLIKASDWFVNYSYLGIPLLLAGLVVTTFGVIWLTRALLPRSPQTSRQ